MVRKIVTFIIISVLLVGAICTQANAYSVYEDGSISSTYVTYFKDILSGIGFNDNYVAFRSGQYSYTMIVGELLYDNGTFLLLNNGKEYTFLANTSGYNQNYKYQVKDITNFDLDVNDNIIYSDLGDYPQLMERGAKYEILSAVLMCIAVVCFVIDRIFFKR